MALRLRGLLRIVRAMTRFFLWILSLPLFIAALTFALQNRATVEISFWPFDLGATLPLSLLSIGLLIFGFIGGVLVMGILHIGAGFERRRLKKEVSLLSAKLEEKAEEKNAPTLGPTILSGGRYTIVEQPREAKTPRRFWFGKKKK